MAESLDTKAARAYRLYKIAEANGARARAEAEVLDVAIAAVSERAIVLLPKLRLDRDAARDYVTKAVETRTTLLRSADQFDREAKTQHAEFERHK